MKVLKLLHNKIAQMYYDWAMGEVNPLHPDVGNILMRQTQLRDSAKDLWR